MTKDTGELERGRTASIPQDIPLPGWFDILVRTKDQISSDNLSLVAAGVAFYALLAIFPTLAASVSLYGLLANAADIERQFEDLAVLMPPETRPILLDQIKALAASSEKTLGATVIGGLLLALMSAMKGMKAIITALNIAYNEEEKRGFLRLNLISFMLTLASVLFMVLMLGLVIAVPAVLNFLNLSDDLEIIVSMSRWSLLLVVVVTAMASLYHFAPSRSEARWQWVSWGAIVATALWSLVSIGFSIYVENFGTYNKVYGSLGALVALLMWFYISAYALMLGAELNSEMEHQTKVDTTVGEPKPMGERDAYVADTVGERR
ncbi:MAG: YihY/virulence factor BrkB family protein [Desulforhopalus sp.]